MSTPKCLRIEYWPLSKLLKHPKNPKTHKLDEIQKSMERFGYISPILIDERSGMIAAGHGRIDTLIQLKAENKPAPTQILVKKDEWSVPVICGIEFKNEHELEAYLVADNRLTEMGGWNDAALIEILEAQKSTATLKGTGFNSAELKRLLNAEKKPPALQLPESQFIVLVTCKDETAQLVLLDQLTKKGHSCRALVS